MRGIHNVQSPASRAKDGTCVSASCRYPRACRYASQTASRDGLVSRSECIREDALPRVERFQIGKGWNLRFRIVSVSQGVPLRVANSKPRRVGLQVRMYPRRCSSKSGEISDRQRMELAFPHRVGIPGRAVTRRKQQAETGWSPGPNVSAKMLFQEWRDF